MPKVSVIIPVYNTEKYLEQCLDSVCNQTLSDIEIICVNDCSTDGSLDILKKYAQKDNRIKIIDFKENRGASVARNIAINKSTGKYIGFMDSDDYIDLDFYEKLYNTARENNADAVKGKIILKDNNYNAERDNFYDINDLIKQNQAYFYHSFTSGIYNSNFIKEHNIRFLENCGHYEDPYFSIMAGIYYSKVAIVDNAKYYYVSRKDSACRKNIYQKFNDEKYAISQIISMINDANITKEHYVIIYSYLARYIISLSSFFVNHALKKEYADFCTHMCVQCKYPREQIEHYIYEQGLIQARLNRKVISYELRKKIKNK